MEQIIFGDIFVNIERYLCPKDLYNLLLTCTKIVSLRNIEKKTITKIKSRLQDYFGAYCDQFIKIMQDMDASLMGSFVTQCLLYEIVPLDTIDIYTMAKLSFGNTMPNSKILVTPNSKIFNFLTNLGFHITRGKKNFYDKRLNLYATIVVFHCINPNREIGIDLCVNDRYTIDKYTRIYTKNSANRNIYKFKSVKLYVYEMGNIFAKCTKLPKTFV